MPPKSSSDNFDESLASARLPAPANPRRRSPAPTDVGGEIDRDRVRKARDPLQLSREFRRYLGGNATTFANAVYVFNGTKYEALAEADLRKKIYMFLDRIRREGPGKVATPTSSNVREIVKAFKAETLLASGQVPPCWKNLSDRRADNLLVCSNGILDLSTQALQPLTPDLFTLTALDYPYEASCEPPRQWLAFLAQVFGDNVEAIGLLQEVFGYLLTADTSQQKIVVLHGPRRSGKGTTLRVLTRLLGRGNVVATDLYALGERFGLSPLLGRQVAIIGDAGSLGNSGRALQRLLSISGEDAVTVDRKLDPEMWSGCLPTRFVIATNSINALADSHGALASRLLAIPFRHSFAGREDPALTKRLCGEMPGILNWAIQGGILLEKRGRFSAHPARPPDTGMPTDVKARVARFVAEQCELGPTHSVIKEHLVDAWTDWCRRHGIPPAGSARFGVALLNADSWTIQAERPRLGKRGRPPVYRGIRLREQLSDEVST